MIFLWCIRSRIGRSLKIQKATADTGLRMSNPQGIEPRHIGCFWKLRRISIVCLLVWATVLGCSQVSVVGLQPEYPPVKKSGLTLFSDYVQLKTLQPTFQWQPFPRNKDTRLLEAQKTGRLTDVTYELRIWKTTPDPPGKLVYSRKGIPNASHAITETLRPSTRYLWSVRAHFSMDGHPRVTEWSLAGYALRRETVPNLSCFRFKTPGSEN